MEDLWADKIKKTIKRTPATSTLVKRNRRIPDCVGAITAVIAPMSPPIHPATVPSSTPRTPLFHPINHPTTAPAAKPNNADEKKEWCQTTGRYTPTPVPVAVPVDMEHTIPSLGVRGERVKDKAINHNTNPNPIPHHAHIVMDIIATPFILSHVYEEHPVNKPQDIGLRKSLRQKLSVPGTCKKLEKRRAKDRFRDGNPFPLLSSQDQGSYPSASRRNKPLSSSKPSRLTPRISPYPAHTFDSVVGTLVFCTISAPDQELGEIRRLPTWELFSALPDSRSAHSLLATIL